MHGSLWKGKTDEIWINWGQGCGGGEGMRNENMRELMVKLGEGLNGRAMKEGS